MSDRRIDGTYSQAGQHTTDLVERRLWPFGLRRRYVVRIWLIRHLTIESRYVGTREVPMFEASFRRLEVASRAHVAVIEGLLRGGLPAAKERVAEFR